MLKISKIVSVSIVNLSGCSKSFESQCGILYKNG